MQEYYQLDFFKDPEICRLESEVECTKEMANKVRKALFARHNELKRQLDELKEEHEIFKKNICRGNI